ncbi:MAG: hypothetical protein IPO13_07020 [Rhodocyclaceae bacterium]|nr:hypothetical protein [Rhodocyclaceae bacterium]
MNIANEIDSNLPQNDQFDAQGNELSLDVIDKKWAHLHQQKLIMFTKKALDFVDATAEKETPLTLLEAALKKLTHEDFVVENIPHAQYQKARELASNIQVLAKDIEHQLYNNEKKKNDVTRKK